MSKHQQTVAIVGAGISGLSCARRLQDAGWKVRLFDKGKRVGGRCATRRIDSIGSFDHGAQYFTVRDSEMMRHIKEWTDAGIVAPWQGRIGKLEASNWALTRSETTRYVGTPGMRAFPERLAQGLDIQLETRITSIAVRSDRWQLFTEAGTSTEAFDFLILTAPAPQSAVLTRDFPQISERIALAEILPCWSVMVAFESKFDVPWDAAFVEESALSWIARNSSKPGRSNLPDCWMLHANPEWSQMHIEQSSDWIMRKLLVEFWRITGKSPIPLRFSSAHRWRYSIPSKPLDSKHLLGRELNLGLCGDWCGGPRIEGAYLSGLTLADAILSCSPDKITG